MSIRDNGPGFTQEQWPKVFKAFYTTKIKGTGLGLAISRRIVEAHGGRIDLVEGAGLGAEFVLNIPRGES
jgi:signal transduction histidine kinase